MVRRTLFTADFNTGSGNLSTVDPRWSAPPDPSYDEDQVTSGVITPLVTANDSANTVTSSTIAFPADQWASSVFAALALGGGAVNTAAGVRLRDDGPNSDTCYDCFAFGQHGSMILRIVGGVQTVLNSESGTVWAAGDALLADVQTIDANTVRITLYRIPSGSTTPSQILTVDDTDASRILSGQTGVRTFTNAGTVNNAQIDSYASGAIYASAFNLIRP